MAKITYIENDGTEYTVEVRNGLSVMEGAIRTLKFMKEQGVLLALRDDKGPTGELASAAYFELMNPKVITGVKVPEGAEGEGKGKK